MYQIADHSLAGGGGGAAFAPAKWPAVAPAAAANPLARPTSGASRHRRRLWAAAALLLAGSAVTVAAAYDGPSVGPVPRTPAAGHAAEPAEAPETVEAVETRGTTLVVGLVPGEPVERAMARAGVAAREAAAARRALDEAIFTTTPAAGTQLRLHLGDRPNFLAERPLETARYQTVTGARLTLARGGRGFRLEAQGLTAAELPRRIAGPVGEDLSRSLHAAGLSPSAASAFLSALRSRNATDGLHAGDRFLAVVDAAGALLIAHLDRANGSKVALMPWTGGNGRTSWFDADGVGSAGAGQMQRPVPGPVSSGFGIRVHPILGFFRMHKGADFRAAHGTPIVATMSGRVASAGWSGGYGRQVRLDHSGGLVSTYAHMSEVAVAPGALVRPGQVLGYVGSSGLSTGPHLHYELLRGGVAVDPLAAGAFAPVRLTGEELGAFRKRMRQLLSITPSAPTHFASTVSPQAAEKPLRL